MTGIDRDRSPGELLDALGRAIVDVPAQYVRVVDADVSPDGRAAAALVLLNADEVPWPRITVFDRHSSGEWRESFQDDAGTGVYRVDWWWTPVVGGRAEPGRSHVSARHREAARTREVRGGWFFIPFWLPADEPEVEPEPPELLG